MNRSAITVTTVIIALHAADVSHTAMPTPTKRSIAISPNRSSSSSARAKLKSVNIISRYGISFFELNMVCSWAVVEDVILWIKNFA